jgi:Tannase-like family of unknown function (DUF6351)
MAKTICTVTVVVLTLSVAGMGLRARGGAAAITIRTLSTRADRVSGGDVLVEVAGPGAAAKTPPQVALNGRDVSTKFQRDAESPRYRALLDGLVVGRNVVSVAGKPWGAASASLELTNYPASGPIFSGPHVTPFICQTDTFKLPDGSTLGPPADQDCSAPTRVQHMYLTKGATALKPLPVRFGASDQDLPAMTTTSDGRVVPFIVHVETGTINRAIYQIAVLDGSEQIDLQQYGKRASVPWNRRLIAVHGTGCPGGWYVQGSTMGVSPLTGASVTRLGEGYAIFTSTLNHPSNSCNAVLAGETTMMVKERAIELLGVPEFTVSMGTSGGAYTSLQLADAFPGLFDGILINATFPDALSIALAGEDAHLLSHYVAGAGGSTMTEAQQVAVSGYSGVRAWADAANQSQRTDPVPGRADVQGYSSAVWNAAVPVGDRYDPVKNPRGARPTVFDAARTVYGVDPVTGFARRPFDNVGVQYGLNALNAGVISVPQFLDLNERIGGYDQDSNYIPARSVGDAGAIARAYESGLTLGGSGGLGAIPVFDDGAYNDTSAYHYQWFHFAIRERIEKQGGDASNHVMWRGPVQSERAWTAFITWVAAVAADGAAGSAPEKVVRNKPAEATDGCWAPPEGAAAGAAVEFVAERQTFSRAPDSRCNRAYPSYGFTRLMAGGPLNANVLKCQLRDIDIKAYVVAFSADDVQRLRRVFPTGVCDWSKPGDNQVSVITWNSFGPAPPPARRTR